METTLLLCLDPCMVLICSASHFGDKKPRWKEKYNLSVILIDNEETESERFLCVSRLTELSGKADTRVQHCPLSQSWQEAPSGECHSARGGRDTLKPCGFRDPGVRTSNSSQLCSQICSTGSSTQVGRVQHDFSICGPPCDPGAAVCGGLGDAPCWRKPDAGEGFRSSQLRQHVQLSLLPAHA